MKTKTISLFVKAREAALDVSRRIAVAKATPTEKHAQLMLFSVGIICLAIGLSADVYAGNPAGAPAAANGGIDDTRIANAVASLFRYLEGSFGALIMAASGIGAIMSAAFGQYKAALSCMVVAVGSFILRAFMNSFFNTESLDNISQEY